MLNKKHFTLVEIMIVVAIIGILAAIALPGFSKARTKSQTKSCIANLKQLQGGAERLGMDGGAADGDAVKAKLLANGDYLQAWPKCPANNTDYADFNLGADPVCPNVGTLTDHKLP